MTRTEIRKNFETIISIYKDTRDGKTKDTVAALVDALGYENAVLTVAELVNTVGDWDQRISERNRKWACNVAEAASRDEMREMGIYQPSEIHPAHIDQIADAMRKYEPTEPTEPEAETAPSVDPAELVEGDVVEISGAYFKSDNGLFFVTRIGETWNGAPDVSLHKVGKTGKVIKNGSNSWPLRSYVSSPEKRHEARKHNRNHAKLTRATVADLGGIAEYFRNKAEQEAESIKRQEANSWTISDAQREEVERLRRVCARFEGVEVKKPEPETGIKFYWNGIKVNGGDLIKCYYSMNSQQLDEENAPITIYADGYGSELPTEFFAVRNDSDIMTDYFEKDRATVDASHPLYKYVRFNAWKSRARGEKKYTADLRACLDSGTMRDPWPGFIDGQRKDCERREAWLAKWDKMTDPGQPTAADLAAVEEMKTAAESARIEAEKQAKIEERERVLKETHNGRVYIEGVAAAHPVEGGAPVVEIPFSEHPAFYSWTHSRDQIKVTITTDGHGRTVDRKEEITEPRRRCLLSVAAADEILKHYDAAVQASEKGYYKTDFVITWTDDDGEPNTYEGRYDIGDGDGGLVAHIRAIGEFDRDNATTDACREAAEERIKTADFLAGFLPALGVVKVEFAPWLLAALEQKKQKEAEARERFDDTLAAVEMLTDEQLIQAVNLAPYADPEKRDVGRFFLQQLAKRDEKKALDVFRRWINGEEAPIE